MHHRYFPMLLAAATAAPCAAAPGGPVSAGLVPPVDLDLREADAARWLPGDSRDPVRLRALDEAWAQRIAPLRDAAAVRLVLPAGPGRVPLILAASRALHAANPAVEVFLAYDREAPALWDEAAWGALAGGALLPGDLGPDPAQWAGILARAQTAMPGRPWTLWLPADPGARLGELLGDGGRVVVPAGGPGAALAAALPAGPLEVEGGLGKLRVHEAATSREQAWAFRQGAWAPEAPARDRHEVRVTAADAYDVGALLGRVRAERLRESLARRSAEADLSVDLHIQSGQGPGSDLGFRFRWFQAAGEPEETLQKTVLFNGVKANLGSGLELPIIESRTGMASPAALTLTERYRYRDGGEAGKGVRRIRFEPVDRDPTLYAGSLLVEEATGRVLEERSSRSGLPGVVLSEDRTLTYGDVQGAWCLVGSVAFERWVTPGGVVQVTRTHRWTDFQLDGPDFLAHREAARGSKGTMLRATPDGVRYLVRQKDGSRKVEDRPRTSGRAIGGVLLVDPTLPLPVVPLAGLAYFDYDALGKGIQVSALTAVVFNTARVAVPDLGAGFNLSGNTTLSLLPATERPVRNGHLVDGEGVGRRSGDLGLGLAHDLGAGFRVEARGDARYDAYSKPWKDQYWTEGYVLPPSGWTTELDGTLSWLHSGFQVAGDLGAGRRPEGVYGLPGDLRTLQGAFRRYGGHVGYDYEVAQGRWLHGEAGYQGGTGFDRFHSLDVGGLGGDVRVAGMRSNAITADRLTYAKAGVVLPTGPRLRLTLSLDQAWIHGMDDQKTYAVTGLGVAGDLPGFGWFTTVRVDLGVGLLSTLPGVRSVNGLVALLRVF